MLVMTPYAYAISLTGFLGYLLICPAFATTVADLSNQEASRGIKGMLPLPPALNNVAKGLRLMGRGKDADELVATMNQAAERAIPEAKPLLVDAVKAMSVEDGKKILTGDKDSVTRFFRGKTAAPL